MSTEELIEVKIIIFYSFFENAFSKTDSMYLERETRPLFDSILSKIFPEIEIVIFSHDIWYDKYEMY